MAILKRLGMALVTLFFVTTLTFFVVRNTPGDALQEWALEIVQTYGISMEDAMKQVRAMYAYNPDEPVVSQYVRYVKGLAHGDLGTSILYKTSVNKIVERALPWTVFVLSTSLLLSFTLGSILGMIIAWKRKTVLDPLITGYAALTGATPDYITALILLMIFAINLKWFPTKGAYDPAVKPAFSWPFIKTVLHHAVLPIAAYTFENTASWALAMKGSAVSVLGEDYIMAARARGLKESRIMTRYMGRNAMLPLVTGLAIAFGGMMGGSVLIETIFNYPGIGWFFNEAVNRRDYGLMQGLFFLTAAATIFANFLADILYTWLDPRIRLED